MTLAEIEVRRDVIKSTTDPKVSQDVKWNLIVEFLNHVKANPADNGLRGKALRVLEVIAIPTPVTETTSTSQTIQTEAKDNAEPSSRKSRRRG